MSNSVTEAQVLEFNNNIRMLQQQKNARIVPWVLNETQNSVKQKFDQVDAVELVEKKQRHGDIQVVENVHKARWVTTAPYEGRDFVDWNDLIRILNDPTNRYVESYAAGANRRKDQAIIDAAFAVSETGEKGDGSVAFPAAGFDIPAGGQGLTVAKVKQALRILEENENEPPYTIVISAQQKENYLGETEVISSDFSTNKPLMTGMVGTHLGFNFVQTQLLGKTGNDRQCIAFGRNSMLVSMGDTGMGRIEWNVDKGAWQVSYRLDVGATRMDEKGVVRINCTEV